MPSPALAALLLFGLIAFVTATTDPTDKSECHVDWFRVVVPGKMVYAWNCVCDADDGTPFVYGGSLEDALDFNDTSQKQIDYTISCFNYMYDKYNLLDVCQQTPGKFYDVSQPMLVACTKGSEEFDKSKGPFSYSREECVSYPSQVREVGSTVIAAVHICQCTQPAWSRNGGPETYVLDGRAPFVVPISSNRPDVVDYMMECMKPFESHLQYLCAKYPEYYSKAARLAHAYCCDEINEHTSGTKLDCKTLAAM